MYSVTLKFFLYKTGLNIFFFFLFRRKLINFSEMANNQWTPPTRKNTTVSPTVFRKEKKRMRQAIIGLGKHLNII